MSTNFYQSRANGSVKKWICSWGLLIFVSYVSWAQPGGPGEKINLQPANTSDALKATPRPGKIAGVIRNEKNEAMAGVSILVENTNKGATSLVSGDYSITLDAGTYSLLISYVGYESRRIADVVVKENKATDISVILTAGTSKNLQAVVVTSSVKKESIRSLLMAQKNNASMTDGISAEQIRLTPDNNTGQLLKRVSGITVQSDKFVTIRGLGDRYNNVLINGAILPSTEPNRRNFSFDIIPTALIDNVVVNKTATPDLPSEFTGGIVQITTKDVPTENFLTLSVGTGFNTSSYGKSFVSHKRDENASLGIVDKNRKWFGDGRAFDQQQYVKDLINNDTAAMRKVGGQIPNRWQTYRYTYTPVQNYQLIGGLSKSLPKNNMLGLVAAITYRNEQLYEQAEARSVANYDALDSRYKFNTAIGGLLNIAYKAKKHKLALKNLYNYRYSNQYFDRYGLGSSFTWDNRTGETTLTNRLIQTRLEGEHSISKINIKLDWFGDYITLRREQPDGRYLEGRDADSGKHVYTYNFNDRFFPRGGLYASVLNEKRYNGGANLAFPFVIAKAKQSFKAGYVYSKRDADFDATALRIISPSSSSSYATSKIGLPYYQIATTQAITRGDLMYLPSYVRSESTGDRYTGEQDLQAGFAMLDLKMLNRFRIVGGMRYENNKMAVSTVTYTTTGVTAFSDSLYPEKDWLPSVNFIYSPTNQLNIRTAYSKTLSRPDFVERSPYTYYDFTEQLEVRGETALEISRIDNYDLRLEYYPSGAEIISASLFYKKFDKPVEQFYILEGNNTSIQYQNLHSATAKGFEVDIRKSLSFIAPRSVWLENLFISANYTYLQGEIKYLETKVPGSSPSRDTSFIASDNRPVQGLSPYIINGALSYHTKTWGFNIGYNRFGRRIVTGGLSPTLVQYENPRDVIDLQLSACLLKNKAEIKFNISDLLNQYTIIYSNNVKRDLSIQDLAGEMANNDPKGDAFNEALDFVNYKTKKGTNFSIIISYKF